MFGGHTRQSLSSASSATTSSIDPDVNLVRETEWELSKNSRKCQNKINQQEAQIKSLQAQTQKLQGLFDPKSLVNVISQTVTTSPKLGSQLTTKGGVDAGFISKPYLGKSRPSQLAPCMDRSLNPELECWYCKDTGHLKDNCIKLNHQLANDQKAVHNSK